MAVAAVTLSCNGGAQTKLSLERVACPPLDPKPHQHLRHLPWSGISHASLPSVGAEFVSRWCLPKTGPGSALTRPCSLSLSLGMGGKAETLRIRSPGGAAPSLDAKQSTRTAPGWLIKYPFIPRF